MEGMIKHFIKNMSKEEKQKMMQAFIDSLSEEEKAEMIQLMMPVMMKDFNEDDCRKMITEMPPETRQNCKKMLTLCLQALEETEKTPH